jgi:hypothetical protein
VADVNQNGSGFCDNFFAIQKIWQVGGWVLLDELRFDNIKPLIFSLMGK